jgi:hypothetical protein
MNVKVEVTPKAQYESNGVTVLLEGNELRQLPSTVLELAADSEIALFENFFRGLGNEVLAKPERAMLKTYLAWKFGLGTGAKKNA